MRSFTPQQAPPPAVLGSIDINPATVVGGNPSSGTVVLSSGAPEGGAVISLTSSNPAVASVPASTTAPSNSFTAGFTIATATVSATTVVTITARYNGTTRTGNLTINPPGSSSSTLTNLAVSPATVSGGSSAQGAVVLVGRGHNRDERRTLEQQCRCGRGADKRHRSGWLAERGLRDFDEQRDGLHDGDDQGDVERCHEDREPDGDAGVAATAAATAERDADGERERAQRRADHVEPGWDQCDNRKQRFRVVHRRHVSDACRSAAAVSAIWSGACSSGGNKTTSCTFTVNGASTVSANVQ